ncbi:MAG: glycosyltransferase, partial [Bacteroidota bacterium]
NGFTNRDKLEVVDLEKNAGKGNAICVGVEKAKGDHILTMDADAATSPLELLKWIKRLPDHTFPEDKVLIASREHDESKVTGPMLRKVVGLTFNAIIQLFTNLKEPDTQCGFKLYPKVLAKEVFGTLMVKGWAHDVEILYRFKLAGYQIESMPVTWEHVDDAKINVFQDGIKMLFQTMLISVLVKIKHFFRTPLKQPFTAEGKNTEAPLFRFLFALTFLFLLFFMPYISKDYGMTGDEHVQRVYGDKLLKHYKTNGDDNSYKDWKNLKFYGGLFDYLSAKVNPADDPIPPAPEKADAEEDAFLPPVRAKGDVYTVRHRLNALTGVLLIFFTGLLARAVTGSWLAAWLAMLFVALSPRIFGHSMNNPKDIPFAAAFAFT